MANGPLLTKAEMTIYIDHLLTNRNLIIIMSSMLPFIIMS